jgi:hypothetical protein
MQVYIEGYLQAMLDTMFRQDYLKVKVTDEEVGPVSLCDLESQLKTCLSYPFIHIESGGLTQLNCFSEPY